MLKTETSLVFTGSILTTDDHNISNCWISVANEGILRERFDCDKQVMMTVIIMSLQELPMALNWLPIFIVDGLAMIAHSGQTGLTPINHPTGLSCHYSIPDHPVGVVSQILWGAEHKCLSWVSLFSPLSGSSNIASKTILWMQKLPKKTIWKGIIGLETGMRDSTTLQNLIHVFDIENWRKLYCGDYFTWEKHTACFHSWLLPLWSIKPNQTHSSLWLVEWINIWHNVTACTWFYLTALLESAASFIWIFLINECLVVQNYA